jgi:N-formylglutamate amidohydrolase
MGMGRDLGTNPPTIMTAAGPCPAFEVLEPVRQTSPLVFCSPHSGRAYPASFLSQTCLDDASIRRSEDLFVDRLFEFVPALGAPMIVARFPRAYLDVNREPYELDPQMFDGPLPPYANCASVRVAGGLGTVPRIVAEKQEIYAAPLDTAEALGRIETIYHPFHRALNALLERTQAAFGFAVLIDCHSMPSTVRAVPGGRRPDVIIGDRIGTSAAGRLVAMAAARLSVLGWNVVRNKPYAGGFITERYGRPHRGVHAIQIELNRGLYADEERLVPHRGFDLVQASLRDFVSLFGVEIEAEMDRPAAAE